MCQAFCKCYKDRTRSCDKDCDAYSIKKLTYLADNDNETLGHCIILAQKYDLIRELVSIKNKLRDFMEFYEEIKKGGK